MQKTALLLGIHCHQPVDNFHYVVKDAIERSYRPFFENVIEHKSFKFSIHYSGWLLEFIRQEDPKLFKMMQEASKNGQIEFLSGGFYEPILASIPSRDRISQIRKLNLYIEKHFKQAPKGLWLTERVWDNAIIKDLHKCDIEYVVVDDYHFISSGFDKHKLKGYYVTEDEGIEINIFPINKDLRYMVPFHKSKDVCNYLENMKDDIASAAVIFDDGEKFGIWPQTYEWVYEKGWLKEFIENIEKSETIEPVHYYEYMRTHKPLGLAYLPVTSYFEMGEWSLKGSDAATLDYLKHNLTGIDEDTKEKFIKGSIWKNFLVKYPESNRIHKRFLELSNNRVENDEYLENLFKAQTNDVLWHGVFGGIYLPNLRDNAYRFIIECENIRYKDEEVIEFQDINIDGYDEVKFVTDSLIALFDTKSGAQMVEFDLKDKGFNLQNCMTRYKEAYHEKILNPIEKKVEKNDGEEEGIETIHDAEIENIEAYQKVLKFDWYTKNSFIDHIVDESFTLENFESASFKEYGDFANQPFDVIDSTNNSVLFKRAGGIFASDKFNTSVEKQFAFEKNIMRFNVDINSNADFELSYVLEMNFHFANIKGITINEKPFEENFLEKNVTSLSIKDSYTSKEILFTFENRCELYVYRLDTLSQSEAGFDMTNQGITFGFKSPFIGNKKVSGTISVQEMG